MIVLNFYDTEPSVVNHVNSILADYNLAHLYTRVYRMTKNFENSLRDFNVNYVVLDMENANPGDFDIDELCFNLIEVELTPVVKLPSNKELRDELIEAFDTYSVKILHYDLMTLTGDITLTTTLEHLLIEEFFLGNKEDKRVYSPLHYSVHVNIIDNQLIYKDNSILISEKSIINLLHMTDASVLEKIVNNDVFLSRYLPTPLPFILIDDVDTMLDRLNNFKINIFYKIANLSAREISELPQSLSNLFTRVRYIPLDILKDNEIAIRSKLKLGEEGED